MLGSTSRACLPSPFGAPTQPWLHCPLHQEPKRVLLQETGHVPPVSCAGGMPTHTASTTKQEAYILVTGCMSLSEHSYEQHVLPACLVLYRCVG